MFFRRKPAFTRVEVQQGVMRFLGPPTGEGLGILKDELKAVLVAEGNTLRAYLLKVQHPGEEQARLAMVMERRESALVPEMASAIARACQPIVNIDFIFLESLSSQAAGDVLALPPFFVASDVV